ncbi:MAG: VOC family protein [Myxococcales bacterium]|nr:VOC family protein [Myxococcales bacterium]
MPEVRAHRPGTFCWADLPSTELDRAIAFYSELFNWSANEAEMPEGAGRYVIFQKDGKNVAAAYEMPEAMIAEGVPAHWESYIATRNVDELTARAAELGATVVAEPHDMPGVARMAVLADPEGASFTLYQAQGEIGAQRLNEPGALCWYELYARDLESGSAFYADLFGYEIRRGLGSGGQPYYQFGIGAGAAAGAMQLREEWGEMPAMWMVYFQTDDLDAAIARAESHGGAMIMAPTEVPGVGRFTMLSDPQGAYFMIMEMGAPTRAS